jgi:hypothetical protein
MNVFTQKITILLVCVCVCVCGVIGPGIALALHLDKQNRAKMNDVFKAAGFVHQRK